MLPHHDGFSKLSFSNLLPARASSDMVMPIRPMCLLLYVVLKCESPKHARLTARCAKPTESASAPSRSSGDQASQRNLESVLVRFRHNLRMETTAVPRSETASAKSFVSTSSILIW